VGPGDALVDLRVVVLAVETGVETRGVPPSAAVSGRHFVVGVLVVCAEGHVGNGASTARAH